MKGREVALEPIRVSALEMNNVHGVACGQGHMLAVVDNGHLAAWGSNEYGQLGEHFYIAYIAGRGGAKSWRLSFAVCLQTHLASRDLLASSLWDMVPQVAAAAKLALRNISLPCCDVTTG